MYSIAIAFYAFIARLIAPFHKKAKLMTRGQKQTFDILRNKIEPGARYIWFHAASLGEFEQGRPLIEKIRKECPEYKIILTFFSPSGYEVRKNYEGADIICYLPFDFFRNATRFLDITQPTVAIFIKYEFWMNYLDQLKKREIPTYIISAIFRPDQVFFHWYGKNYRNVLKDFNWLFVQNQESLELLKKYDIHNVTVSGDTRFDRVATIYRERKDIPLIQRFLQGANPENPVLVAGSTWSKDEEILIPYFNQQPRMKLIIAPHEIHEEHLQAITAGLKRPYVRYSQASEEQISQADCVIIDCFGLLSSIYRYGTIAYIGGGFGAGIHNVLEAAVYGIPVIFGPNYQRFKEARDLIQCKGAFSIQDDSSFTGCMDELQAYPEVLKSAGKQAGSFVEKNTGATEIIFNAINLPCTS